jgi:signal peptidase
VGRFDAIAIVAALALLGTLAAVEASGLDPFVVEGGSMEPAIPRGSLVLVRATMPLALKPGDVITFARYGEVVTHRIEAIEDHPPTGRVFTTRGDANPVADPERVAFDGQVGLVRYQMPLLGYFVATARAQLQPMSFVLAATFGALALRQAQRGSFAGSRAA